MIFERAAEFLKATLRTLIIHCVMVNPYELKLIGLPSL